MNPFLTADLVRLLLCFHLDKSKECDDVTYSSQQSRALVDSEI